MIRIRYLTLLVLLMGSISLWAQDDTFNPSSPDEPGPPGGNVPMLTLVADPADGGSVRGAGWYAEGTQVTLRAANKANYVFDSWVNAEGETVSTTAEFKYTKLAVDETLTARFRFSPGSPAEPTEPSFAQYYQLTVIADEGGTASGGGRYQAGTSVRLTANASTGYVFDGWYNQAEQMVAATSTYYYVTTEADVTLTARFHFSPSSPGEPSTPVFVPKHTVTVTAEEGGTVNTGGATLEEGKTISLSASANTGYVFMGWYVDGTLYRSDKSFTYTMGTEDIAFTARFNFNPGSPGEPSTPITVRHSFYLMNKVTKPGKTIKYPVYLSNISTLKDMSFQLSFPKAMLPDTETIDLSENAIGYSASLTPAETTDTEQNYVFTLTGGSVTAGNTVLLKFNIRVPEDIETAQNYPVKINQVTVVEDDGTQTTASTRNGRISVYKNGDANGDDVVDALDASLILQYVAHKFGDDNADFIKEAADTNNGDEVDALDASLVLQHAAKKIDLNEIETTEE